ncbi:hypothetical protein NB701_002500 [Pantoea ananatis]|nr:hypothetical protein [Pantoea ananatis]
MGLFAFPGINSLAGLDHNRPFRLALPCSGRDKQRAFNVQAMNFID